jgi:hypothetical protein
MKENNNKNNNNNKNFTGLNRRRSQAAHQIPRSCFFKLCFIQSLWFPFADMFNSGGCVSNRRFYSLHGSHVGSTATFNQQPGTTTNWKPYSPNDTTVQPTAALKAISTMSLMTAL